MTHSETLTIFVDSDQLLRKKWRGLAKAEAGFREEARAQVGDRGPLSGEVSVALTVHAPDEAQQPHIPGVAKAYLDALQGIVYDDDRQVSHLTVRRFAMDHPILAAAHLEPTQQRARASVFVEVMPVARYTELYDRAFKRAIVTRRRAGSPWRPTWRVKDHSELWKLRWRHEGKLPGGTGPELESLIRDREESWLRDGFFADHDRPGPLPPIVEALNRVFPLRRLHWRLRQHHGAVFLLPLPGQGEGTSSRWKEAIRNELIKFRDSAKGLPFSGFVALDLAVRGVSLDGKDLDNLVHTFLVPFEKHLCQMRGTVVAYRAYEAVGHPKGIQVRVLDSGRLLELDVLIHEMAATPTLEQRVEAWLAAGG
jgi:Endodeoxyribonuclease RusA